jgi:hypothetical protein
MQSEMFWRARGRRHGRLGRYSLARGFTTAACTPAGAPAATGASGSDSDTAAPADPIDLLAAKRRGETEPAPGPDQPGAPNGVATPTPSMVEVRLVQLSPYAAPLQGEQTAEPTVPPEVRPANETLQTSERGTNGTAARLPDVRFLPVVRTAPTSDRDHLTGDGPPGRDLQVLGIGTGGLGVASLAVGVGFGLHASALSDDLSRPGTVYHRSTDDAGRMANRIAITGYISGALLMVAGASLYWRGVVENRHANRISLAPVLSERFAGLRIMGGLP